MSASTSVGSDVPLILIADDDRSMRTLLDLAVTEQGYRATGAKDGEQCLSEYKHQQPDMVLLDAMMPEMDGFECCQRLRQLPGGDRTPILMITVLDDRESVDRAFEAGATDYITKPIHWAVLSQRVRYLLAASAGDPQSRRWEVLFAQIVARIARQVDRPGNLHEAIAALLRDFKEELQSASSMQRVAIAPVEGGEPISFELADIPPLPEISAAQLGLFAQYEERYRQGKTIALKEIDGADFARSALMIPIQTGDRLWGVLCGHYCTESHAWDIVEVDRFTHLANILAIAIRSCQAQGKTVSGEGGE
ncbi:MAG: response regulator [Cyanobacteriota bacterium]|nr:response regulator [Cyanobacteriota bacterium]